MHPSKICDWVLITLYRDKMFKYPNNRAEFWDIFYLKLSNMITKPPKLIELKKKYKVFSIKHSKEVKLCLGHPKNDFYHTYELIEVKENKNETV